MRDASLSITSDEIPWLRAGSARRDAGRNAGRVRFGDTVKLGSACLFLASREVKRYWSVGSASLNLRPPHLIRSLYTAGNGLCI